MPDQQQFSEQQNRLSEFLRKAIDRFMCQLDIQERTSSEHEDRVHYEGWVRFCVTTSLLPDVLAAACGTFTFDAEVLNERMPVLLERVLTPLPMDAGFIGEAMSGLPDHERMQVVDENLHLERGDRTLAEAARDSFDTALYETLGIQDPPIEWDYWALPEIQRSGTS